MNHAWLRKRQFPAARAGRAFLFAALGAMTLFLSACGPSVMGYAVSMRYLYAGAQDEGNGRPRVTINVARFSDGRVTEDRSIVGAVRAPWRNEPVPVALKEKTPAAVVTDGVKAKLAKSGFVLSPGPPPVWDLEAETLDKAWGRYVLGGVIEELYLDGRNDPPFCTYEASVRLAFVLGDTKTRRTKRFFMERESFLRLATMNEDSLERQINTVLSQAIAEGLSEANLFRALRDVSREEPVR